MYKNLMKMHVIRRVDLCTHCPKRLGDGQDHIPYARPRSGIFLQGLGIEPRHLLCSCVTHLERPTCPAFLMCPCLRPTPYACTRASQIQHIPARVCSVLRMSLCSCAPYPTLLLSLCPWGQAPTLTQASSQASGARATLAGTYIYVPISPLICPRHAHLFIDLSDSSGHSVDSCQP